MPKAHETKSFIIEKTAPVFNKKGVAGTSIADLERATGLTKGSIYNNFAGKDEVALAAFDYNLDKVNTLMHSEMDKHSSPKEKLRAYLRIYGSVTSRKNFPSGGCPVLNTAIEADDTHPALRKKVQAALHDWTRTIESLIKEGIQKKEFSEKVKPADIALTILATIEGAIMIARVTGHAAHLTTVTQSLENMIDTL